MFDHPLTTSQCLQRYHISCYSPTQLQRAYNVTPLYDRGITGTGKTIVVVISHGSPTIQHDLDMFDKQFGLPDTRIREIKFGNIPPFDPNDQNMLGAAHEVTIDVEYAHAMAPGANIVIAETPDGPMTTTMDAEKSLIDQGIGDVITQSFGQAEQQLPNINDLRYAFTDAARHNVSVLAASDDTGPTNHGPGGTLYSSATSWPASDPLVTAVGGTHLSLDDAGRRTGPDTVWNDGRGAGGGARSQSFARPAYQDGVSSVVGSQRGVPDISLDAAEVDGTWLYTSYDPKNVGWRVFSGGTSQASPLLAGIAALADQYAGHDLGQLNPRLYQLARDGARAGIRDVTIGDNTFGGVTGFPATPGYDLASGLGTIDASRFVPALAGTARANR
ncbi:hypothetical protein GTS_24260 [Gandjariella thermophila]|uniref:Peptidase S53 domain-containing protein n=1 Tax=Gandjariella thermophila TaxID=1931992 RepID=A0A4D4JAF1_9PSEU|nr:hypothetical protein GTS_24260 [Gandjariella thermophila]